MQANGKLSQNVRQGILNVTTVLLVIVLTGCGTVDQTNFSRMENEPAPLPPNVRAGFGRMGVITLEGGMEYRPFQNNPAPDTGSDVQAVAIGAVAGRLIAQAITDSGSHHHEPSANRKPADFRPPSTGNAPSRTSAGTSGNSGHSSGSQSAGSHHQQEHSSGGHEHHSNSGRGKNDDSDIGSDLMGEAAGAAAILAVAGVIHLVELAINRTKKMEAKSSGKLLEKIAAEQPMERATKMKLQELAAKKGCDNLIDLPEADETAFKSQNGAGVDLQSLKDKGLDSVLLLSFPEEEMLVEGAGSLRFFAVAKITVVRTRDGAVLLSHHLDYSSLLRPLGDWSAHHGRRLKEERTQAQEMFAEMLLEQLFAVGAQAN